MWTLCLIRNAYFDIEKEYSCITQFKDDTALCLEEIFIHRPSWCIIHWGRIYIIDLIEKPWRFILCSLVRYENCGYLSETFSNRSSSHRPHDKHKIHIVVTVPIVNFHSNMILTLCFYLLLKVLKLWLLWIFVTSTLEYDYSFLNYDF